MIFVNLKKTRLFSFKSSLHCIISLSICLFSFNGACYDALKLSVGDIILSQKGSNGDGKLHFFGRDYDFTLSLCSKISCQRGSSLVMRLAKEVADSEW